MTAVETLQAPKTKRLPVPQSRIEIDEVMPQEWRDKFCRTCRYLHNCGGCRDCRDLIEGQKMKGVPDEEILTTADVVALCKEIRAELYEEEQQKIANNR
jgi:sulfatase maturation enzyme AslB (radical SAM superfamily)